jgi:hypothetical protein
VRALAVTWLFTGLRSDEITRLRVGCIRWHTPPDGSQEPVCLLDVPAHKTGTPFTKPVDPLVGRAIESWEAVRPTQPRLLDPRTAERVALLFCLRAKRVARDYINQALIPALCRKAGVPRTDARGRITSHRARSTIASQLYNAKEPMTLFELQAWLGHRSPQSTQHYTQITPTRLAQAYADAGYFGRNLRTIDVLIDREAVQTGTAAKGTPWQYFDLGHGYCTYNFFEQCPHRMHAATSTCPKPPPAPSCWRPKPPCSTCGRPSHSPKPNRPPSTTVPTPSSGFSLGWWTSRRQQARRPGNSWHLWAPATPKELEHRDSTESPATAPSRNGSPSSMTPSSPIARSIASPTGPIRS